MLIPIDEVVHFDVTTHVASTGAVSDADSAPTYDVFEEATDTPILDDQTMTKRTSLTGNYRGSFTASAANGFEAGKWYNVVVSATVSSIAAKAVAMRFRIAPAESVAGVPKVDPSTWDGTDITTGVPLAPTTAGRTLDVSAGGEAGIDWANIGSPTTAQNLSATNIDVDQVVASVSGAVGSVTGAVGSVTAGVTLAASAVQAIWDALTSALTTVGSIGKLLVDNINATISSRSSHSAADVWASATRTLTAATNITSTGGTTVPQTGDSFARLGAPAGASIAADLAIIEGQTDDIGVAGAGLTGIPWNASWDAEVESEVADALEATIADSIPADGTRPSVKQALYMLTQFMLERSVASTTVTVKKVDGSTSLFTLTLNDATTPTSVTRAT